MPHDLDKEIYTGTETDTPDKTGGEPQLQIKKMKVDATTRLSLDNMAGDALKTVHSGFLQNKRDQIELANTSRAVYKALSYLPLATTAQDADPDAWWQWFDVYRSVQARRREVCLGTEELLFRVRPLEAIVLEVHKMLRTESQRWRLQYQEFAAMDAAKVQTYAKDTMSTASRVRAAASVLRTYSGCNVFEQLKSASKVSLVCEDDDYAGLRPLFANVLLFVAEPRLACGSNRLRELVLQCRWPLCGSVLDLLPDGLETLRVHARLTSWPARLPTGLHAFQIDGYCPPPAPALLDGAILPSGLLPVCLSSLAFRHHGSDEDDDADDADTDDADDANAPPPGRILRRDVLPEGLKTFVYNCGPIRLEANALPASLTELRTWFEVIWQLPDDTSTPSMDGTAASWRLDLFPGALRELSTRACVSAADLCTQLPGSLGEMALYGRLLFEDGDGEHVSITSTNWPPQLQGLFFDHADIVGRMPAHYLPDTVLVLVLPRGSAEVPSTLPRYLESLAVGHRFVGPFRTPLPPTLRRLHLGDRFRAALPASTLPDSLCFVSARRGAFWPRNEARKLFWPADIVLELYDDLQYLEHVEFYDEQVDAVQEAQAALAEVVAAAAAGPRVTGRATANRA